MPEEYQIYDLGNLEAQEAITALMRRQQRRDGREDRKTIKITIKNDERYIIVYADMSGVPKDQIDIDFNHDKMTIKGERINPVVEANVNDIFYGTLERTINLPICVTSKETVTVDYVNGMLKIILDKNNEEKNKFKLRLEK